MKTAAGGAEVSRFARLLLVRDVALGINNLRMHGLRSFLTMLGIVFGVASVIAMLAVGNGAGQEALEQIRRMGSDVIMLQSRKPVDENKQRKNFFSVYGLTYLDSERLRQTIPAVKLVVPVKARREQVLNLARPVDVRVVGTNSHWFDIIHSQLVAGRLLAPFDDYQHLAVAVITEQLAQKLFPLQTVVGNFVRLRGNSYRVVGVVRSNGGRGSDAQVEAVDSDNDIYIPLSVMRERYGDIVLQRSSGSSVRERVELTQLLVRMNSQDVVVATGTALRTLLRRFHKHNDVAIQIPLELLFQAQATQRRFNIVLGSIAAISLLVGGIGIMNIMLAAVTERTREIGVRRAIGARRWQIVSQFLIETVVLSSAGGLTGVLLGLALPWFITRMTGLNTVVTSSSLMLSLLISVAVGVVFGLYPAMRAARLDPIAALRYE